MVADTISHPLPYPPPYPNSATAPYWEAARGGRLLLAWCEDCAAPFLYPRAVCPHCWGSNLSWRQARGSGVIEGAVDVYRPGHPAFRQDVPYTCAVVRLEEGPRLMTNLDAAGRSFHTGDRVEVSFRERAGYSLPVFVPAEEKP